MIDVCQWRVSIGRWNCCHVPTSRSANGYHCQGLLTSKLPTIMLAIYFLLFLSIHLLQHIKFCLSCPATGVIAYCTTGMNWFKSLVLKAAANSSHLVISYCFCIFLLLLLSGDIELNPGPITGNPKEVLQTHSARLARALSSDLVRVTDVLYAEGLIPQSTKEKMFLQATDDSTKASYLVNVIENELKSYLDTEQHQYLISVCHVLDQQHQTLADIATTMLCQLGQSVPDKASSIISQLPSDVHEYVVILRRQYQHKPIVATDWLPKVEQSYFGRLGLVEKQGFDDETERETSWHMLRGEVDKIPNLSGLKEIPIEKVLETEDSQSLRVVVDGSPGVGKTTLCRKLFKMWSNGEIKQYELVLYCPLRDSKIAEANNLTELLELAVYESPKVPEVVAWLSDREGKGLLIIFDGWDELDAQSRESSFAARIFCRKTLDQCAVIITSRSYASSSLIEMDTHSKHVQVIGFSEEEVNTVIINTLQKDSKLAQELLDRMKDEYSDDESLIEKDSQLAVQLINEVKIRTDVQSLCYIPLVCSMVIFVYKKEKKLPKTLTQLYETFILHTIKRHIKKKRSNIDHKKILQSLNNLPPLVKQPFQEMCRLAYTSLKNKTNKMSFSSNQLQDYSLLSEEDYLGLMTSFEGYEEWYQFIHLTIQEFLAAWWIAKYEDSPKTVFKQHFDDDHFRLCLRFVAGLTHLEHKDYQQYFNKQLDLQCKTRFRALHDSWFVSKSTTKHYTNAHLDEIPIFLLQLLYESQNATLCRVLAQSIKDSSMCLHNVQLSSFDVMCLSFFIGNSNITWNHLDMGDISARQKISQRLSIFVDGLANKTAISCEKFEVILLEPAEKKEIVSLLQLHFLNNIEEFYFTGHSMYLAYPLFRLLPKIKVLHINVTANLVYDAYETGDSPDLEKCIESNTTLQELDIMFQTVWPVHSRLSYIVSAIKGLTRNKSIKSFSFQHLFQLLFSNKLPSSDSRICFLQKADRVIEDLLKYNKTLRALSLSAPSSYCSPPSLNIEEVNTPLTALCINSEMLASLLPHINGLQHLALTEPLPLLPPELNSLPPSLQTLELKLEGKSAAELFNILQSNTTLKRLRVSMIFTDNRSIGISLQDMLTRNQTLQYLHIIMNTAFMPFLITGLENNTSLQQLTVPVMLYPDDDDQLRTFFNVISQKINLIKLGLTFTTDPLHNQLLDEEVDDQTKPLNNEEVELIKTLLHEQVLPAVTSMLQSHTTMRVLEMRFSGITDNTDAFDKTIQISHRKCTDQFRNFYKTIFNHVSLEYVCIEDKVILEKSFKEQEKARLQQEAPH